MSRSQGDIRDIAAKWDDVLLICRKCGKKADGGFGKNGEQRLEKALKAPLKEKGRYKLVPVPCLGICPKNAVCVVQASVPGTVHLVRPGTELAEVIETLAPGPPARRAKLQKKS
ncbi:(2Fe-2S) ferredoxin domain-containing protein [Novosphingobium sp. TCA1]|uniref:(2Fe-2S) ferredoxin domain-containing protein n=1 Tax=Novosphingobium sp. TCA1 TaxID=2682474 RepID=UPI0013076CFF|nr:(2Fe-2S) ferredoxin domain-containing protein [Novosphingobium sp. TCA1]GFE77024.1 hypothetical protein NTCA1_46730 [Novosphingobium sp. TCA1]